MKTTTKIMFAAFIAMSLSACAKKEEVETLEEKSRRIAYEAEQLKMQEMKTKVPTSEIVGKVQGREVFIHKFYDEKTGANCYFIDYSMNNISCTK